MSGVGRTIVKTLMLAGVVSIFLCGCKKEEGKIGKVSIEECTFPEAEWQLDVNDPRGPKGHQEYLRPYLQALRKL